ncbi:MAG: hypothetical protein AB9866_07425 [Syntrophobacteraceae bacterium]
MSLQDCWGLFGLATLITTAVFSLPGLKRWKAWPAVILLYGLLLVPLDDGLSPAGYLRGIIGDLSTTTIVLILSSFLVPSLANAESRKPLLTIVLIGGLLLYPLSVSPFQIDPYEWGYQPQLMLLALAIAGILMGSRHMTVLCYLSASLLAYALSVSASTNLWDYLIDPLVFGYAVSSVLIKPVFELLQLRFPLLRIQTAK